MAENTSHEQQGQDERAQRIRKQIERLKSGQVEDNRPGKPKSIREQVDERARELEKES
jgi:hypothetical protein